jgi:hypothetical protein
MKRNTSECLSDGKLEALGLVAVEHAGTVFLVEGYRVAETEDA